MNKTVSIIILLLAYMTVNGQSDNSRVKIDMTLRYRLEVWNGMNARNYGDDGPAGIGKLNDRIIYQRIITGLTLKPADNLAIAFHLQDSRAFGWSLRNSKYPDLFRISRAGTQTPYYIMNPNEEFFEIYDAYVEYDKLLKDMSFKLGRQKIFYGDSRIFGPGEWGNTGRWTWDALKVSYHKGENFIDVFAGGTKIHDPVTISVPFSHTEFLGGGAYSHVDIPNVLSVEPFYAYKTGGSADYINQLNFKRNWAGLRLFNNNLHHFVFDLSLVKEYGSDNGKKIDAFGYYLKAGYQLSFIPAEPILTLRESYASGGRKTDDKIYTFEPAYGAQDKYYGLMNITTWSNLDDREIVLELFPVKNMQVELKYNRFYVPVPDDVTMLNTMMLETGKHHLGDEFDAFIIYQALKHWQLSGAFGYFLPGDISPINNKPAKNAEWFALQTLFTF